MEQIASRVSAPTLEVFRRNLDNHLADTVSFDLYSCIDQGVGLNGLLAPFQLNGSIILWAHCEYPCTRDDSIN